MTLREWSALMSTIIVFAGTIWYIYLAVKGDKVKPVLASWIVIGSTMSLSFATYWTTPKHSLVSNACNAASVINCVSILFIALWLNHKQGKGFAFTKFQKNCLWISFMIMIFWIVLVWGLKGTGIIPNILTQILMVIGYLVTAEKLWYADRNSESLFTWWCITIASAIALYTATVSHDGLALLYAIRATIASATLVWLMHRAERKALLLK